MNIKNSNSDYKVEVSVVMPCLNEGETIGICIEKIKKAFKENNINGEIIVSDNGSTDKSVDIALKSGAKVVHQPLRGYGNAYIKGINSANGKYIVMGDGDNTYDFLEMNKFIEPLRNNSADMVMGSRLKGRIYKGAMPFLHRYIGNPVLSGMLKLMFKTKVSDSHCGMRSLKKEAFDRLDLKCSGMEFASEMVIKAAMAGLRIMDIPITYYPREGESKLRTFKDGWRHIRFMFLFSPRWLFLIPGVFFFLSGSIVGGIILFGKIKIGSIIFDANTLLICAMGILIGFQLICFAIFTKIFAISEGLLPRDIRIERLASFIRLEVGLLIGFIFIVIGFGLIMGVFWYWKTHSFGALTPRDSLNITIPGVTILTLGIQIIFSSFFVSILALSRKGSTFQNAGV